MNYVVNMLAKPDAMRTKQMSAVKNVEKGMEVYLKNAYVCLTSVKMYNPDVIPMLAINFELNQVWKDSFEKWGIELKYVKFGEFKISDEFDWGIVQYRYDVMKYLCGLLDLNDNVIMLDTDVVCTGDLSDAFDEIKYRLCLFDVQHSKSAQDRKCILDNYRKIYSDTTHCELIHYGGEFIGANKKFLQMILDESTAVMRKANEVEGLENFNDEHITSIAVYNLWNQIPVNNANAYIYRYWTNRGFYLASTNYFYNPVVLWHLPFEKDKGILLLYKYICKKERIPDKTVMAKIFGLPPAHRSYMQWDVWQRIARKIHII